ncbi:xanthine dehydrogenase family protein molybdopterin-binding subunit [Arenibaculum pallidiluteum]|uniref:xanthine dehydrogenase family protein molybdopterin-binding subunit n=1 Tax=Arenibaculum pallidiluteum TaxID=2812559 RepID=UPI001A978E0A|nr:molybdopterin cofactor-binding domain-containing protein [Arenibaculum pallidiluteum]
MSKMMISRRAFTGGALAAAAAGLTIRFPVATAQEAPKLKGMLATNPKLNGWVKIGPDGAITVFTGRVELGQGVRTAMLQIAADELDVAIDRLTLVSGDTALTPDEGQTAGSQSIHYGGEALGHACADARATLMAAAATAWSSSVDQLTVENGIIKGPNGRAMPYGEAARAVNLVRDVDPTAKRKSQKDYSVIGTSVKRVDIPDKVFGRPTFIQDMRPEGMLFGAVARPPAYGAKLTSAALDVTRAYPAVVKTVVDGSFIGVIGTREEQVRAAAAAIAKASQWTLPGALFGGKPIFDYLKSAADDNKVVHNVGDVAAAQGRAIKASYQRAFQSHASIGASCALAVMQGDELTVWSHTQGVFPLRRELSAALKMAPEKVRVIHAQGSGCYGHNGADDVALDAALLARAVPGRPVRVLWTHEEEMTWEPYSSAMETELQAVLDAEGKVSAWSHTVWSLTHNSRPGSSKEGNNLLSAWYLAEPLPVPKRVNAPLPNGAADRNAVPQGYAFPNQKVTVNHHSVSPIRTSALRTLGAYMNVFSAECFLDEVAAAAGKDPVSFRLAHFADPRLAAVTRKAVEMAGWTPRPAGPRQLSGVVTGTGIAVSRYKNSEAYLAIVATVEVDTKTGDITPISMHCAVDVGHAVSPDGVINQVEGGIIQSTSQTLLEGAKYDDKLITSNSYGSYPIIGFDIAPKVEVAIVQQAGLPPVGAGEASQGPTAAALGNAVADAIGKRVRTIPLTPRNVLEAIRA